jgi:MFS family permease
VVAGAHRVAFGALTVAALLLVRNTFNSAAEADTALNEFAVITACAAAGALIAAILTPAATRRLGAVTWSIVVLLQAGTLGVALVYTGAMTPSMPVLLAGAASIGFAGQGVKVCADTLVQRHVPDDHLGRVFAIFDMVLNVCLVTGIAVMAFGAPKSGQAPALILGIGVLLAGTALWYRWASSHRLSTQIN